MMTRDAKSVFLATSLTAFAACSFACSEESGSAPPAPRDAAPSAMRQPAPTPTATADGYHFEVAGLHFNAPGAWVSEPPNSSMRVAQFQIPSPADSPLENGEVAFFYFGPTQGGDVASNLDRWSKQVIGSNGEPATIDPEVVERAGLRITTVVLEGTYQSGMPGTPPTPKPDWMFVGGIVEGGPEGSIYIRIAGPEQVIGPIRGEAIAMIRSAHPAHS